MIDILRIPKPTNLDPITVYLEDEGEGRGRATIVCYNEAWTCYWGSMRGSLLDFMARCNSSYLVGCMTTGRTTRRSEREYAERVAAAVIGALQ
jgi:hypothetical protein